MYCGFGDYRERSFIYERMAQMRHRLLEITPAYHEDMRTLYQQIRHVWMAYLRGQIVLMIVVGIVFTIAWIIMGIPGALVLGVIAGLLPLCPDVGPFVAAMLATWQWLYWEGSPRWIPLEFLGGVSSLWCVWF